MDSLKERIDDFISVSLFQRTTGRFRYLSETSDRFRYFEGPGLDPGDAVIQKSSTKNSPELLHFVCKDGIQN
jgi:hypothetical protein